MSPIGRCFWRCAECAFGGPFLCRHFFICLRGCLPYCSPSDACTTGPRLVCFIQSDTTVPNSSVFLRPLPRTLFPTHCPAQETRVLLIDCLRTFPCLLSLHAHTSLFDTFVLSQHRYILCPLVCAPCLGLTQLALASPSNAAFAPLVGTPHTSSPPLCAAPCMCSRFCMTPQCLSFSSLTAGTCFNIQRLSIAPLSALAIPRPYAPECWLGGRTQSVLWPL